ESLLRQIVHERWQPAARVVADLVGVQTFRRIPFLPHPLLEALSLLFTRLVEEPEDAALVRQIGGEAAAILLRTPVDPRDLFGLFATYQSEFELIREPRLFWACAPWFVGPDPRGEGSCMESDPRVVAIRKRLKGEKAEVAIAAFRKLCTD